MDIYHNITIFYVVDTRYMLALFSMKDFILALASFPYLEEWRRRP